METLEPSRAASRDTKHFRRRITVSCVQCRKRKIKCDRTQPCQACSARGLVEECVFELDEGRRAAVAISDEVIRLRRENKLFARQNKELLKKLEQCVPKVQDFGEVTVSKVQKSEPDEDSVLESLELTPSNAPILFKSAVQLSELQAPLLETFINFHAHGPGRRVHGWLRQVAGYASTDTPLLGDAIRASALMYCATEQRKQDLKLYGLELHGKVLSRLQTQINDPLMASRSETLFTTMLVALHEVVVLSNPLSWLLHIDGMGRLMQYRGPNEHTSGMEHLTFRFFRLFGISLNVFYRRPSFLSTTPWKTWPWAKAWPSKDMLDLLLDTVADAPLMFSLADEIKLLEQKGGPDVEAKKYTLANLINNFTAGLDAWFNDVALRYPGGGHADLRLPTEHQQPFEVDGCMPDPTGQSDLELAEALSVYYAARLLLLRVDPEMNLLPNGKIYEYVSLICSTVEFQLERETEYFGAFSLLFPLRIAYFTPLDDVELKMKLQGLFRVLAQRFQVNCLFKTCKQAPRNTHLRCLHELKLQQTIIKKREICLAPANSFMIFLFGRNTTTELD